MPRKLTAGQVQYLNDLAAGECPARRCRRQCEYGGLSTIAYSLARRGLVTLHGSNAPKLTIEGWTVVKKLKEA